MRIHFKISLVFFLLILNPLLHITHLVASTPIYNYLDTHHPVSGTHGMVASQQRLASEAGLQVLKEGGNAIDAAVTMGFVLAVTLPRAGNIGGGGFMMVHLAKETKTIAIDYREKAPQYATQSMFISSSNVVDRIKSQQSVLSCGVPGTVSGLLLALEKYGTISRWRAMQPAIRLAAKGFLVDDDLSQSLVHAKSRLRHSPESYQTFYKQDGEHYATGDLFKQPQLAHTLRLISKHGPSGFYEGTIANRLVNYVRSQGGILTREDLNSYEPVIRTPISGDYRGYTVYSMPPPSSGGVLLLQLLGLLEPFPLRQFGHNSAKSIHLMTESMKLAYADRSRWLGDTDFVRVPLSELTSPSYIIQRRKLISMDTIRPSSTVIPGQFSGYESPETTHFSVVDRHGNAVSNTYTLNFSYGSGHMAPGTGFLLNNEMDDFSAKPGVPNAYGLVGGRYNAIAPGKRMLSSMTPTIVLKDTDVFLVTGSPGGSRIITTVLQVLLNVIDYDMSIAEATHAPRFHHQWVPNYIRIEKGFSPDTIRLLQEKGHSVKRKSAMGSTQSILRRDGKLYGSSDPRKPGALTLGY